MSDASRFDSVGLSRRDWLKASGVACGASAGASLSCASAAAGNGTANLSNPEQQAGTNRIKHYIRRSRELALAELKPTRKQIDRALALHAESIVCDPMGGSLTAGELFTPALDKVALAELARIRADGNGPVTGITSKR